MENFNRKKHWENLYQTKELKEVSWFQPNPETSLDFLLQFQIPKTAKIIDIGGGDSFLVDHLLDLGYQDISVLDISAHAIERAKQRLGKRATHVNWIISDVVAFQPTEKYDFWHDRAAFHFLTDENEISQYLEIAQKCISPGGILVIGTFSEMGPKKCSGIEIKQYSEASMTERLKMYFEKIKCISVNHKTPFDTIQNFVFCSFKKMARDGASKNSDSNKYSLAEIQYYHGTKADLKPGDLIEPGFRSNFGVGKKAAFVYLTATLDAATWAAELAQGDGPGRIYIVEPTGPFEDDPNLTDKKFPGNPTKSYRTRSALKVTGEIINWQGHPPEVLKAMKDHLERLKEQGIEAIED